MFGLFDLDAAVMAALKAGDVLLGMQRNARRVKLSRRDFVTDADHRSDRVIREALHAQFRDALAIYSEEGGGAQETAGDLAIVDALDGTVNYWYGDRTWAVSIAIVRDGRTRTGVIYAPQAERLYVAHDDMVAKYKAASMHVGPPYSLFAPTKNAELKEARVDTDWIKGNPEKVIRILRTLNDHTILPRIPVCCTVSVMRVAAGELDGFYHPGPMPEDIAAAGRIAENAGCTVTDEDGRPWTPFSKSLIVTNGLIHDELLKALAPVVKENRGA